MRGERQLLRLGEYLVSRACQRLPQEIREERYREWAAELPAILHDPQVRFAPWRAARMLGYAADTWRGAAMTPRRTLDSTTPSDRSFELLFQVKLLFVVLGLAGVAISTWAIVQAPGNEGNYLQVTWSLLFTAYFTSRLVHAPAGVITPLMFSAGVALEALTVWQTAQAPGNWVNYLWAAFLGLVLLAALLLGLARWFPGLPARTRKT